MPRLTVSYCVPTHGRPRLLLDTLESAAAQTRLPDEIVVSDDQGNEETRTLVEAFAKRTSVPVRYILCAKASQVDNVNNLLQQAKGDLILLIHDDDLSTPRAIELLVPPLEENPALVGSFGKQLFISEEGEELHELADKTNHFYRRDAARAGLQSDGVISGIWQQFPNNGFVVRTAVAREVLYQHEHGSGCDFGFGIGMGLKGTFFFVNEFTAKYRLSVNSVGRGAGSVSDDCAYRGIHILLALREKYPRYDRDIVAKMKTMTPMGVSMALHTGKIKEAADWYFGPYHRVHIPTPGGIRRGLRLAGAWLRQKFNGAS
jgi:glycosyltransferase involved in cell wall biosynthesis